MTYRMPCHARGHGFFHHRHVTYRTPCHASGHLVHPASIKVSPGPAGLHADLRNIAPARLFV